MASVFQMFVSYVDLCVTFCIINVLEISLEAGHAIFRRSMCDAYHF